ncbi:MAG TPA: hypothetical protein PKM88_15800 [bacterium]|nr:hypothetical protein [bacterium]
MSDKPLDDNELNKVAGGEIGATGQAWRAGCGAVITYFADEGGGSIFGMPVTCPVTITPSMTLGEFTTACNAHTWNATTQTCV